MTETLKEIMNKDHFAKLVGYRPIDAVNGTSEFEFEANESHLNPGGTLHGGALFSVMDSSQGAAVDSYLSEAPGYAGGALLALTAESTVRFKRPHVHGRVRVLTRITDEKRRLLTVESVAYNESDDELATLLGKWVKRGE